MSEIVSLREADRLPFLGLLVVVLGALAAIVVLLPTASATTPPPGPCEDGYVAPTPTEIPVTSYPITVNSTTADYFVLYIRPARLPHLSKSRPILVKLGEAGTTTLTDNLKPLSVSRYLVEKYSVAQPGDLDGDCADDVTELKDLGNYSPLNSGKKIDHVNGAVFIESREAFQVLSFNGDTGIRGLAYLNGLEFVKFSIRDLSGTTPPAYFINANTHKTHSAFDKAIGAPVSRVNEIGNGTIVYYPNVAAKDGSLGVYAFRLSQWGIAGFTNVKAYYDTFAANMPFLTNNLYYHPFTDSQVKVYKNAKASFDNSRVNVLLNEHIGADVTYIPFNQAEGYGRLRLMQDGERPSPFDIAIYETLPNDLPRVGGTITTVTQTPLSHVNLRAIQNRLPNAYIGDALTNDAIASLLGSYVYFAVTADGYTIHEATKAEVDNHYAALRPQQTQTLQRDLTTTSITSLSNVNFADWTAFGVKAANAAELTKLSLPAGTTPVGYAVPFYFYDEFMKQATLGNDTVLGKKKAPADEKITLSAGTTLATAVTQMLAHSKFQSDADIQEEMLDDLRKAIKNATSPQWIITALTAMHGNYTDGQSLRYRSSTNNEDLPSFNGAGLYDSKTQDSDETTAEGIDKSIKAVWASLWNYRAFLERDFHRVDHTTVAMGVLVHPNYSDETVNGVAVSYDPITFQDNQHYINSQVGEDLVTNPEAASQPEQLLLSPNGATTVLSRSNLAKSNKLLMSAAQMQQLRSNLDTIHNRFRTLYQIADGDDFAIEIEFKITAANKLAIKQVRPWIFPEPLVLPDPEVTLALGASQVAEDESLDLTVTRSGGILSAPLTVRLSWSETESMLNGEQPASITISGNQSSATIAVPIDDDTKDEPDSVLTVSITSNQNYDIGTSGSASATITDNDESTGPEISIVADGGVTEGTDASYTLTATPKPAADLDVAVEVTQSGDFVTTGSQTVTITTTGTATLTVPTTNDSTNEPNGSVTAAISPGTDYTVSTSAGSATVAVSDDDSGQLASQATIDSCVTGSVLTTVRRYYDVNKDRAPNYGRNWKRVLITFRDVQDSQLTPFTAAEALAGEQVWFGWRPIREALECIEAAIAPPPPTEPEISIAAGAGVTEGTDATFTVTATPAPSADLDVTVGVSQSGDYVTTGSRTVTITTSGSATFTVATTNDATDEPDGSVTATISSGTGYTVSSNAGAATVAVSDDDAPTLPEISIAAGSGVTEGTAASFTLTASPAPAADLDITIAISQSGDYVTTGSLTITIPSSGSKIFTVTTTDDSDDESDGSVTATISSATGYTVASNAGAATVAVSDNDAATLPEISITAGSGVTEGTAASFTLTASPTPTADLDVTIAVSQSGDYVTTGSRTVTIPTSGSKIVTVTTTDDSDNEPDGSVTVAINNGSTYTVSSSSSTATVAIADNDTCAPTLPSDAITITEITGWRDALDPTRAAAGIKRFNRVLATLGVDTGETPMTVQQAQAVSNWLKNTRWDRIARTLAAIEQSQCDTQPPTEPVITITAGSGITEGTDASFTVTATPTPTTALTVNLTISQSGNFGATIGADTVTIPTTGSATYTVGTTNDNTDEPDGSVTATLSTGSGYTVSGSSNAATVSVSDDDDPPPATPTISIAAGFSITEGTDATFTVTASPNPTTALTVNLTVSQSGNFGATTGADTVTIPTTGSATFTISTSNDNTDEPHGSVTATLSTGTGYTIAGTNNAATVAVSDDDDPPPAPPTISIAAGSGVTEGSNATFTVTASPAPATALTVNLTVSQSGSFGAATGTDTVIIPTTGSATFTVSTTNDNTDEPHGSVTATLSTGTGYTVSGSNNAATVAVSDDDDPPPPTISIAAGSGVTEGSNATFTVTASPAPATALTVNLTVSQSGSFGATTGTDTVIIPTTGSATFTVSTTNDNTDEPNGSVTATLTTGTGYTVSGSNNAATVAVSDNDDPQPVNLPTVSISDAQEYEDYVLMEFYLQLSHASSVPVTVTIEFEEGTATYGGDYLGIDTTQTIAPGQTRKALYVPLRADGWPESDETFTIKLTSATNATIVDDTGNGIILNDD